MSRALSVSTPKAAATRCFLPAASMLLAVPAGVAAFIGTATPAFSTEASLAEDNGPQSGTLMMRRKDAETAIPAIQLGTDMNVTVSGNIARISVSQVFRNTSQDWVEGTYLFPLPENAAVDTLKMTVGSRVIIGKIKKREEAREIYEEAKADGKKAGLVEQQRPNMFTNEVANIGPGETVLVVIEYQMPLDQLDGTFRMRLPLVVGARYIPPHTLTSQAAIDDANKISAAPIVDPRLGKINPVSITVDLAPGFVPANIESPYHTINIDGKGERWAVNLADSEVPQDRDFELSWRSASASPVLSLYQEQLGGKNYIMASLTPPVVDAKSFIPPREMVFVIDNSGSMSGESMVEAKASLIHALGTLRPTDHFNIIRFDDTMELVFETSVAATPENIEKAKTFTNALEANGGTEMLPALKAALVDHQVTDRSKVVRQVIFLTDGDISNEDEMLEAIGSDNGNSRVFTVGIGSAPNNYLMRRMATHGRGIYTNIGDTKQVTVRMAKLLDMLSRPSVQDLKVTVTGNAFDLTPKMLPDLYAGEPLLLLGVADSLEGNVTVSGMIGSTRWEQSLDLTSAIASSSVAKLWARQRIDDIEADRILGKMEDDAADAEITELGLGFHIVTSLTSLVAVDETPSRPANTPLREEDLPINLPKGWDFDHLFGGETASAALANEAKLAAADSTEKFQLPQTATNYGLRLLGGLLAFLIGAFGLVTLRRKKEI